ncbi:hypothetical protein [Streptomyces sp. H34-S4]|uniref:hypothetical protein n=1 Tax=Streptomyces sp. H34-S4 TaxID=2996463 RepID=UPI0022705D91|nr:hypothetical protein [Streptomyces sp. H34-S4]MCY0935350.1 hypothetical protein [Streptomyces sp. H34-S4]
MTTTPRSRARSFDGAAALYGQHGPAALSVPEARRVLKPGGALAIWWNDLDESVGWVAEQGERIRAFFEAGGPGGRVAGGAGGVGGTASALGFRTLPQGLDSGFATGRVPWSRRIPLAAHLANLASHSAFLLLGAAGTGEFLDAERERLKPVFPDGVVEEPYVVNVSVATM